jgi:hypothetical protein
MLLPAFERIQLYRATLDADLINDVFPLSFSVIISVWFSQLNTML